MKENRRAAQFRSWTRGLLAGGGLKGINCGGGWKDIKRTGGEVLKKSLTL